MIGAAADKALLSFPNVAFFSSSGLFYFLFSLGSHEGAVKGSSFFPRASINYTKAAFDVGVTRSVFLALSPVSDCGVLKVRSERPFDNYRKTFITRRLSSPPPAEAKTKQCVL